MTAGQLDLGGYKIVTTIDKTAETSLIAAEQTILPKNQRGTPESGAASVVPGDGAIAGALRRSRLLPERRRPTTTPASTCPARPVSGRGRRARRSRPSRLLAALQKGISLSQHASTGRPSVKVDGVTIHNSSPGESCYGCTLTSAFAQSINTIFVPLGPDRSDRRRSSRTPTPPASRPTRNLPPFPTSRSAPTRCRRWISRTPTRRSRRAGSARRPYLVSSVSTDAGKQHLRGSQAHQAGVLQGRRPPTRSHAMTKVLGPGGTAVRPRAVGPAVGRQDGYDRQQHQRLVHRVHPAAVHVGLDRQRQRAQTAGRPRASVRCSVARCRPRSGRRR